MASCCPGLLCLQVRDEYEGCSNPDRSAGDVQVCELVLRRGSDGDPSGELRSGRPHLYLLRWEEQACGRGLCCHGEGRVIWLAFLSSNIAYTAKIVFLDPLRYIEGSGNHQTSAKWAVIVALYSKTAVKMEVVNLHLTGCDYIIENCLA